jgi:hypothetical protein
MSKPSRHLNDELYVIYTSEWISELAVCWLLKLYVIYTSECMSELAVCWLLKLYVTYTGECISELAVCWLLKFSFSLLARRSLHWPKRHLQWTETFFFLFLFLLVFVAACFYLAMCAVCGSAY